MFSSLLLGTVEGLGLFRDQEEDRHGNWFIASGLTFSLWGMLGAYGQWVCVTSFSAFCCLPFQRNGRGLVLQ